MLLLVLPVLLLVQLLPLLPLLLVVLFDASRAGGVRDVERVERAERVATCLLLRGIADIYNGTERSSSIPLSLPGLLCDLHRRPMAMMVAEQSHLKTVWLVFDQQLAQGSHTCSECATARGRTKRQQQQLMG